MNVSPTTKFKSESDKILVGMIIFNFFITVVPFPCSYGHSFVNRFFSVVIGSIIFLVVMNTS